MDACALVEGGSTLSATSCIELPGTLMQFTSTTSYVCCLSMSFVKFVQSFFTMATEIASQNQALAGVADVHSLKAAVVDSKVADQSPSIDTACNSTGSPVQEPVKNEAAAASAEGKWSVLCVLSF